ncbi:hypothetical protein BGS_0953 [Beggiatoa sp. SS]|nr:hypothetical protein BGS_0953 [Beggiatoa sp. SS]
MRKQKTRQKDQNQVKDEQSKNQNQVKHDQSYKRLFSHPKMVEDLLRGFVHEDWVNQFGFYNLRSF